MATKNSYCRECDKYAPPKYEDGPCPKCGAVQDAPSFWEVRLKEAIEEVEDRLEETGEPFQPSRKWGISSEMGEFTGLNLRKTILEDALLIGRHGLPKGGQRACMNIDCKSYGEPHIAGSDICHIFGE